MCPEPTGTVIRRLLKLGTFSFCQEAAGLLCPDALWSLSTVLSLSLCFPLCSCVPVFPTFCLFLTVFLSLSQPLSVAQNAVLSTPLSACVLAPFLAQDLRLCLWSPQMSLGPLAVKQGLRRTSALSQPHSLSQRPSGLTREDSCQEWIWTQALSMS